MFSMMKVCDDRHSELIPCLDRNLIYETRLKLDLSVMEHYERHCPVPERRYNCLIPPPPGYKVRYCLNHYIKWNERGKFVLEVSLELNSLKLFCCFYVNRSQSSGLKAETRYGKQIYLIRTLRPRSLTKSGWLSKVKRLDFLEEVLTSIMELASTSHQWLM